MSRRATRILLGVVFVVAVFGSGFAALTVISSLSHNGEQAQRGVARANKAAKTAKASTDKVSRKVDRQVVKLDRTITVLGKAGVNGLPGKSGSTGPPGIEGVRGPPGPAGKVPFTLQDVISNLPPSIQGPQGEPGPPGRDATDAQALDAMTAFCAAHNDCRGDVGPKGDTGPAGADGAPGPAGVDGAQGPPGPAGVDSTVPGPAGPQGPPGADGVTTTVLVVCTAPGVPDPACP